MQEIVTLYIYLNDKEEWQKIISKVNTIREMTPSLKIELDINNSLKAKLQKHLPVDTIFTVPRDILSGSC